MPKAPKPDHAQVAVRLKPGARTDEITGERDGRLLVSVSAPPIDGRANEALCRLLAKRAGVARGTVQIIRGARSRDKLVRVEGLSAAELRRLLSRS